MEELIFISFLAVIFVLSVPLHEVFHYFAVKCLGGRGKLKLIPLSFYWSKERFGIKGSVEGEDGVFDFPKLDRWKRHFRLVGLLLGLSGGLGAAIVLAGIGTFFLLSPVAGILVPIWKPFFAIASIQLVVGVFEAIRLFKQIELVGD